MQDGVHPELAAEQAHVDRAYDRLSELEAKALALAHEERTNFSRTFAGLLERDVRERAGLRRRASLRLGSLNLCFGRIDCEGGATYHLGRVAVADADQEPLIVDWRAPVAEPFYRATSADPLGLRRRRHLITKGRQVLRLDDELLGEASGEGDAAAGEDDLVLVGEAALLEALRRARTGRMGDIVSTIQAEQDRIIRAPLGGIVVVQGGPGTGKTAVALHRAAYLLYTHRFPLEEMGVLFVGPNPVFLRYIERVLPTLGESGCRMVTPDELVDAVVAPREDAPAAVRLKGDVRLAEVVSRAVRSRQRPLRKVVAVPFGAHELRLGPRKAGEIVSEVAALPGTHNARRPHVEAAVYRHLGRQYRRSIARAELAGLAPRALEDAELDESLRASKEVRRLLDRLWPVLTPARLLDDLFGLPALLAEAADGVLSPEEQATLVRPRTPSGTTPTWSVSDLALLDEAAPLLGPTSASRAPAPRRAMLSEDIAAIVDRALADATPECPECASELTYVGGAKEWRCEVFSCGKEWFTSEVLSPAAAVTLEQTRDHLLAQLVPKAGDLAPDLRTYGHVVVDEAQDLSPMQWRMLARRCPSGSMTIVGDLGQASGHWAPAAWQEVIDLVPAPRSTVVELTVNYRTPGEVMAIASRVLASARPDLTPARSVRDAGVAPRAVACGADVVATTVVAATEELGAVDGGKVAVIVPASLLGRMSAAIHERADLAGADDDLLAAPVSALTLDDAKGLEFDSVVVVEPSAIADEHPHGLGALYVALTRTTTRLVLVHSAELPAALAL
ncbi:MAG TPA: ATP-binding domain-containing protein [Acidimicrobiales bacterium]|nr:ATP-binding domain-containing protein [Acidimicrobiales bacterium]